MDERLSKMVHEMGYQIASSSSSARSSIADFDQDLAELLQQLPKCEGFAAIVITEGGERVCVLTGFPETLHHAFMVGFASLTDFVGQIT